MNMSVFNVPVTIGVDEDKIAREIESEVKEKVIRNIGYKVEEIIYKEYDDFGYSRGVKSVKKVKSNEPLRRMVERKVDDILEKERDAIISFQTLGEAAAFYKLTGLYDWICDNCPNRKVIHQMKYAKKKRVRDKNFKRAIRIVGRLLDEE